MIKATLCFGILLISSISAFAQTKSDTTADEQAVLKTTHDWLDAEEKHNRAALLKIIADDFQGTTVRGTTVFKEDIVPEDVTHVGGLSLNVSDLKARLFGDIAILTGKGVQKTGLKRDLRFTIIYAKRNGSWQMVGGHISAIPQ
jgi:hypothetical protein